MHGLAAWNLGNYPCVDYNNWDIYFQNVNISISKSYQIIKQ